MNQIEYHIGEMSRLSDSLIHTGELLSARMEEYVPSILSGETPFEGSELEELLEYGNRPEKRESIGWGIVESVYYQKLQQLFCAAPDSELKFALSETIKEKYQHDPIHNCHPDDSILYETKN